jgi:hypothetical protein
MVRHQTLRQSRLGCGRQKPRGCQKEAKAGSVKRAGLVGQVNPAPFPHLGSRARLGGGPVGTRSFLGALGLPLIACLYRNQAQKTGK